MSPAPFAVSALGRLSPGLTLAALLAAPVARAASGGEPVTLTHAAYALNALDEPLTGTMNLEFGVFATDTGGTAEWTGACGSVTPIAGYFSVRLGSATCPGTGGSADSILDTSDLPPNAPRWLETKIGTVTLAPRLALETLPAAARAALATRALAADGLTPAGLATIDERFARLQAGTPTPQAGGLALTGTIASAGLTSSGDVVANPGAIFSGDGSGLTHVNAATIAGLTLANLDARYAPAGASTVPTPPVCNTSNKALGWNGSAWVCVDTNTGGVITGNANGFEARDPWGFAWDGIVRAPRTWTDADSTCTSLGGRLPTASEVFRDNATSGSGSLGDTTQTQALWTRTRRDASTHLTIRLNDGTTSNAADTSTVNFRCVWPDSAPTSFTGDNCMGPAGAGCLAKTGGFYNVDRQDRPAMPMFAAIDECAFYAARLPELREMEEIVRQGLPNAVGRLWTEERYVSTNPGPPIITFSTAATAAGFTPPNAWSTPGYAGDWPTDSLPFRCVGVADRTGLTAATGSGFLHPTLGFRITSTDGPTGTYWSALDACRTSGGFMPDLAEFETSIRAGLPNGSLSRIWTGEHYAASNPGPPIVTILWSGTQTGFYPPNAWQSSSAGYSGEWQSGTTMKYRCATYPTRTMSAPTCNGGCFTTSTGGLTYWADNTDRTGTYWQGLDACQAAGGYMPDLVELQTLVRAGLPNGSLQPVFSSEKYASGGTGPAQIVLTWSGTNTNWAAPNAWATNGHGGEWPTANMRYRCVWTNAVR